MPQHKLEQAIAAFDHWRQNRTKRTHTPNELRQLAVELADSHSHNHIATALRINARQLKIWCDHAAVNSTAPSDFMSLPIEHEFESNTDDTSNRILDKVPIKKPQRNGTKMRERTGVYSTGLVAGLKGGHNVVLYKTNIGHAGEFIDELLSERGKTLSTPILMSDALSSNRPSLGYEVQHCLCNSHGRRQFAEVLHSFPTEVEQVLTWYGMIWDNDHEAKVLRLSSKQRLAWHKKVSLPVMEQIREWGETELNRGRIEENSGLGKAIGYFNKHYDGLSAFCRIEGAPIDNNKAEQALKLVARNRKNAMFHKTQAGASIADVVMGMIATSAEAGINVLDYFNTLQRKQGEVKANPQQFLPWNYLSNI